MTDTMNSNDGTERGSSMSSGDAGMASGASSTVRLPWGATRERVPFPESIHVSTGTKPGAFALQMLFAEFIVLAEKKIEQVLESQNKEKPLSKLLQRGEDAVFDQLLSTLNTVSEHSLPSLLHALFEWYARQNPMDEAGNCLYRRTSKNRGEKEFLCEKRDLAVDFLYCLVLIEILKQLPYHPGHEDLVNHIISLAFRHFKYRESGLPNPNAPNVNIVADLYAEVIGVLAQSRFPAVKKRFMFELRELRSREQTPVTAHCIISLLMGMKFFRVKMHPIEEFQASIQFLHECGQYFLELKDRDKEIKHALAGLFVEILLPVAAVVNNEVNVPVLKNFVELMYVPTMDMALRRKHMLALFPMVTCLLSVSQKQFFLNNWPAFLQQCLSKLRDRDPTTARVALESLYRLLWVYMIRIKCESNTKTISRLQSIVNSLFPKGSRVIMPKEAPLSIFVKIVQFIAQERLDFAMREIIFDLLSVGKPCKTYFAPERMCIGLRAFLVIADGRQQHEGDPPMPQTMGVLPSGSTLRFKKTYINKFLSEQTANNIGLASYYGHVRKAFDGILKYLDSQVGRSMLLIRSEYLNREPDEIITGERKPKIDMFRTCIAALPRLLPEGMSQQELIDMLARLTVHMDDELCKLAFQSLQSITIDLPDWRTDVINGYVQFIQREVTDSFPQLLEQCNRRLISLLTQWKSVVQSGLVNKDKLERAALQEKNEPAAANSAATTSQATKNAAPENGRSRASLHLVEGLALVMLCSSKPVIRKQAIIVVKEVRNLFTLLAIPKDGDECVLDMMDRACPLIIERVLPHMPGPEKAAALQAYPVDFQWLTDRTSIIWTSGMAYHMPQLDPSSSMTSVADTSILSLGGADSGVGGSAGISAFDSWILSIAIFMQRDYVVGHCSTAVQHAWPYLFTRLQAIPPIDLPLLLSEGRTASLLRGSASKKLAAERDMHLTLWKNYVVMGCCIAPPSHSAGNVLTIDHRCVTPDITGATSPDVPDSRFDVVAPRPISPGMTARELFKTVIHYVRCEVTELRETAIIGLGHSNLPSFRDLMEEVVPLIKEAIDRRTENPRRKKKRDNMRVALLRIFNYMAINNVFTLSISDVINPLTDSLSTTFVEFIDGMRLVIEMEADKENPLGNDVRLQFSRFIHNLIHNTPVSRRHKLLSQDLRAGLCGLFAAWSGRFGLNTNDRGVLRHGKKGDSELELAALQACAATLCCGVVFDPSGLNENGYIYSWLNRLLSTHNEMICKLAHETIVLLLEFNQDAQTLLEWVMDRCFTGTHEIADNCFFALATVFTNREYPCDQVAMLNVVLLNSGNSRTDVQDCAIHLLHLLYKRFYMDDMMLHDHTSCTVGQDKVAYEEWKSVREGLFTGIGCRSQICLSATLAALHPDLTMPIFSEIVHRVQTASYSARQALLNYLLPWLYNMELVDQMLPQTSSFDRVPTLGKDSTLESIKPPLKGRGWGSPEATNMILNNLIYMTLTLSDDHATEIEQLWAALVACWSGNLTVIMRYIIITVGMYPHALLPGAKKVIVYLARVKPERLIDELMNELRSIEPLQLNVERIETPPFYRLTKRQPVMSMSAECDRDGGGNEVQSIQQQPQVNLLDKGQIHTKRHSAEDPAKLVSYITTEPAYSSQKVTSSPAGGPSQKSTSSPASGPTASVSKLLLEDQSVMTQDTSEISSVYCPVPHPLPMPAFGGYYAPMLNLLPSGSLPNPPYQRCNLAVMLMTDLILDSGYQVDWTVHLPIIIHIAFLGLDNPRPLIHEHCKQLMVNLLLVFASHNDPFTMARLNVRNRTINEEKYLMLPTRSDHTQLDDLNESLLYGGQSIVVPVYGSAMHNASPSCTVPALPPVDNLIIDNMEDLVEVEQLDTVEQVTKTVVEFLLTRKCRPLWANEDITSKVHRIKSADSMESVLKYFVRIFKDSLPSVHIQQRWAQEAIHLALSCSSRHYAGRSFQVFRALHVSLTCSDLCDILSRLVETVAEQGDDMQGYVTEIMLTLEAAVDNLDVNLGPLVKELFMSTPNLAKDPTLYQIPASKAPIVSKSSTMAPHAQLLPTLSTHLRSTSYNLAAVARKAVVSSPPVLEHKEIRVPQRHPSGSEIDAVSSSRRSSNLLRSRSTQSLRHTVHEGASQNEDRLTTLVQMFWISVSMLGSDYEYEFLLAVRLLDKVLKHLQPDRPDFQERLDRTLKLINWNDFPGVQSLLLKGLTSTATAEPTWNMLSKLTPFVSAPIIDPTCAGFPMNVMALMPYLVEHYDEPTKMCAEAAMHIADVCQEQSPRLDNLATVMTQYSHQLFTKGAFQWTKCVVHHLYAVYSSLSDQMIAFLVEVLDKGPASTQPAVLEILHCIVYSIDISTASIQAINADLLRVVAKYVENGSLWKDALKIIKLCVAKSSSYGAAPANIARNSTTDASVVELPGRTMDFIFDQTQLPIIGSRFWDIVPTVGTQSLERSRSMPTDSLNANQSRRTNMSGTETNSSSSASDISSWRRPLASQTRTRERLVSLLNCYGPRIIPKSPSALKYFIRCRKRKVIFDPQQSPAGTLDRASSITPGTSSDEASTLDGGMTGEHTFDDEGSAERQIQSVFDFLEEAEDLDRGCEYWGANPRHSLNVDDEEEMGNVEPKGESSDDDTQSISPVEEFHPELSSGPSILLHSASNLRHSRQSITGSNQSIHSASTDVDTAMADVSELSPSHRASPSHSTSAVAVVMPCVSTALTLSAITVALHDGDDTVDRAWREHVNEVVSDGCDSRAVRTFHLFPRLFTDTRLLLSTLTTEVCASLMRHENLKEINSQLSLLKDMTADMECPLVYCDFEAMEACRMVERHRFLLLELHECYGTYLMRRDQTAEALEQLKITDKRLTHGEGAHESPIANFKQRQHLVGCVYRVHFQLLQMFDCYCKLVLSVSKASQSTQIADLSLDVAELRAELQRAASRDPAELIPVRTEAVCQSDVERLIIDSVNSRRYGRALQFIRQYGRIFHGEVAVAHASSDIETILYLYCRHIADAKPGYLAVWPPSGNGDLSHLHRHLMDIKIMVSGMSAAVGSRHPFGASSSSDEKLMVAVKQSDTSTL